MNCLECQEMLQRRLDGEAIVVSPPMRLHLANCHSCRMLHASCQALLRELSALPVPEISGDFSRHMTDLVMENRRSSRERARRRVVITAALAASVLVMALTGYFMLPFPGRTLSGPDPLVKKSLEKVPVDNPISFPPLAKSVDDTRQAFLSLPKRWAYHAREQTMNILSAAKPADILGVDSPPDMAESLEPAAQSLRQAGHDVADSWQPVTTSAGRAVAYFLRDLPVFAESQ